MSYAELPAQLRATIEESDFLSAYECVEIGSVIVWVVNHESRRRKEIEFSLSMSRILSAKEREEKFPAPVEISVPGLDYRIIKGYRLEQGTDVRYETYEVYSSDLQKLIVACEQIYCSPVTVEVVDVVRPAIESALFPIVYGSWSLQEQVNYWVGIFYRLRRQAGEDGAPEDAIFDMSLLGKMRKIDPNVDAILPFILEGLAVMESGDPVEVIRSFNRRTGLTIVPR
ncbi:hypothetical protein [Massilia sp. CCM 8734]|uniref:hypothetical protein n=1 Tax=Massilia sp. CCM 8734 TaxID=2609283 RepID=UPI001423FCAF|nr:hypothetical protein [Massilia sp. CCM 8734]NHZ94488.1 hypothetical protein [Massilia sp. CCM 8734]